MAKYILIFSIPCLILYLFGVFVAGSFNPNYWPLPGRAVYAIASVLSGSALTYTAYIFEDLEE